MNLIYSILVGCLFGISVYLLLQASILRLLFGIMIFSSAINLLIFVAGGISYNPPAFVDGTPQASSLANPLPQALILTAIVIGFGLIAYCLALVRCLWSQGTNLGINQSLDES